MNLSKQEKECLQLLIRWSQVGRVNGERDEVVTELGIDNSAYKPLMKKMEEISAVCDVAQGMGQDYAEYFKMSSRDLLQDIWQMIEDGEN